MASNRIHRDIDPDAFLQRLVDLTNAEIRILEQRHRANSPKCKECGGGAALTHREMAFLTAVLREMRMTAFGTRKLLNERLLRRLADGDLARVQQEIANEDRKGLGLAEGDAA